MLIDEDAIVVRSYEIHGPDYALLRRVRVELGHIVASHLETVLCGDARPYDIVLESYELKIIRDIAADLGMESPV